MLPVKSGDEIARTPTSISTTWKRAEIIQIQNLFAVIRTIAIFPIEKIGKLSDIGPNNILDEIGLKLKKNYN